MNTFFYGSSLKDLPLTTLCSSFFGALETGGICIAPKPSEPDEEIVPGMAMRPFFGIKPVLMDTEVSRLTFYVRVPSR